MPGQLDDKGRGDKNRRRADRQDYLPATECIKV
jgi:hypothetical protein